MKRVFGTVEAVFDIIYLTLASVFGIILLSIANGRAVPILSGVMALVLAGGDAFHLIPRIITIKMGAEEKLRRAMGWGKQAASVTMTIFYLLLWQIGLLIYTPERISAWSSVIYMLTALRIFICLLPQNKWEERYTPAAWGIWRNIPFFLQGMITAGLYFVKRSGEPKLGLMWLAIALSFAFYLPVVLWVNKNPKIGMLMLPKTCVYLWMIIMFVFYNISL